MPIRIRASGSLNEEEMSMLEKVLAEFSAPTDADDVRDFYARRLIQLFQAGVREADELRARLENGTE